MTVAEQIQIVEDNLKEYGVCDITIEEFNYLKDELYSSGCLAGMELGRKDAINEVIKLVDEELTIDIGMDLLVDRDLLCERLEHLKEQKNDSSTVN